MRKTWLIAMASLVLAACSQFKSAPPAPAPAPVAKRPALRAGMTKQQVINIKGKPDSRISLAGLECFQYTSPTSAPLGTGALSVYFDSAGRVITYDGRPCSEEELRGFAGLD